MAVAAFWAHFSGVNIGFLVAPITLLSRSLQIGVGPMAIVASHLIVSSLKFEKSKVMNFFAELNREALNIMAGFAGGSVFSGVNVDVAVGAGSDFQILAAYWNGVVALEVVCMTFLTRNL